MNRFILQIVAVFLLTGWGSAVNATGLPHNASPSAPPTLQRFGVFQTPLVPFGASPPAETRALMTAIAEYKSAGQAEQTAPLDNFLQQHPQTVWRVALLANEGLAYEHAGMFTRAIDRLQAAWQANRVIENGPQRALMAHVYGELLWLHTVLGHKDRVRALLAEGEHFTLSGSAQAQKTQAEEGLWRMQHEPGQTKICGLVALGQLMSLEGDRQGAARLNTVQAGPKGVSLARLQTLANQDGMVARAVYRQGHEPIPVPSIVHWKVGHYATIVGQSGGRYHVEDKSIGRDFWMSPAAIKSESSGYFLVPVAHAKAWRTVALSEASKVMGAGITPGNNPNDTSGGDPNVGGSGGGGCNGGGSGGSGGGSGGGGSGSPTGMAQYTVKAMLVSLSLHDTPVGYTPPKGPAVPVTIVYSQREANQPANFTFGNLGQKWTSNWFSYVQDDPSAPGSNVTIALRGGGTRPYGGYNASTGTFAPEERTAAQLVKVSDNPVTYERRMPDGSKQVYGASDNSTYFPRRIFLTQVVDSSGNTVTLSYDSQMRLTTLTDALGQKTTFAYANTQYPLQITGITDPFGRTATITYDTNGRLIDIADVLGMHSQFTYDSGTFITAMTTPYGTTQFAGGESGTERWLEITDPKGQKERVEFRHNAPGIPFSDSPVPQGIGTFNAYINSRNTFYWDKTAMQRAPGDYSQAQIYHWLHEEGIAYRGLTAGVLESVKAPLEHRIWFNYPNQPWAGGTGGFDKPSAIARVLADGSTQLTRLAYNAQGNVTQYVDPVGRTVDYVYAGNGVDLVKVTRKTASGDDVLAAFTYNSQHEPLTYTDAAGQTTTYTYNAAGQRTAVTDPLGNTTRYAYDGNGYLLTVTNANGKIQHSYTYDGFGRVDTSTDSEGHTLKYDYDALDRLTAVVFPDGTRRSVTWDKLDPVVTTDREGRSTTYAYDSVRDLISQTDPMNQVTRYGYFANGKLQTLTDPNGNTSTWARDIEGRVTSKTYADGSQTGYSYDITGRLTDRTDALGQKTAYAYTHDDRLADISYLNARIPTPAVQFTYDPYYPRLTTRTDGQGTTTDGYYPAGVLGAGQLASEQGQNSHDSLGYGYNALGLLASRTVDGATETDQYDPLGRLTAVSNPLGQFTTTYLGETDQPIRQTIAHNGIQVPYEVRYQYETNQNDRRLKAILNDITGRGRPRPVADFNFTTSPENLILSRSEKLGGNQGQHDEDFGHHWGLPAWLFGGSDRGRSDDENDDAHHHDHHAGERHHHEHEHERHERDDADQGHGGKITHYRYDDALRLIQAKGGNAENYTYDAASNLTDLITGKTSTAFTVNALNQIMTAGSVAYQYDANGNLLDDGTNTYAWDAADRLVTITNKQTGHSSQFAYDGLSRRISDTEMDSGSTPATTHYLWCGTRLCEARDSSDNVLARYYAQGELHGSTIAYYAQDQVGSVVATVNPQGQITARLKYDSYGNIIQSSGTLPNYRYAGLFYHPATGLSLATWRAYDPKIGRWLSRDPIRELGGVNLYAYVEGTPTNWQDPSGLAKSPQTQCFNCGGFHGGTHGIYCPSCYKKSLDPNGGVPPLVIDPNEAKFHCPDAETNEE